MLDNASPAGHITDDFQLVFAPLRSVRFLVTAVVSVGVPTIGTRARLFSRSSQGGMIIHDRTFLRRKSCSASLQVAMKSLGQEMADKAT